MCQRLASALTSSGEGYPITAESSCHSGLIVLCRLLDSAAKDKDPSTCPISWPKSLRDGKRMEQQIIGDLQCQKLRGDLKKPPQQHRFLLHL